MRELGYGGPLTFQEVPGTYLEFATYPESVSDDR